MRFQYAPDCVDGEVDVGAKCAAPHAVETKATRRQDDNVFIYGEEPPECH